MIGQKVKATFGENSVIGFIVAVFDDWLVCVETNVGKFWVLAVNCEDLN